MLGKLLIALTLFAGYTIALDGRFQEIFRWNTMDVIWPSEEIKTRAYERNEYIPANNPIAGIKIWKGKMYVTVPRWKSGVPVTLGVTSSKPMDHGNGIDYAPKLEAYPSWEMQQVDNCSAFQFVQSMEIDPNGRMWVLDTGRTETMTQQAKARCPPRLVILDLENNGQVLKSYEFPENVAAANSTYLNDIVLDHEDGGFAYITDNSQNDPGIIVYSIINETSWKIRHSTMKAEKDAVGFMIGQVPVLPPINLDGIALSPASSRERYVYYTPLSSFHIYTLPTWILKRNRQDEVSSYVRDLGTKISQTDGMMMSSMGILYFGLLADDSISMWNATLDPKSLTIAQRLISRDHEKMQWPDTFAFDEEGYLYCTTNALQRFTNNIVNVNRPNYRVIRLETPDAMSYQYYRNRTAPELPVVAGADRVALALGTCLTLLLTYLIQ